VKHVASFSFECEEGDDSGYSLKNLQSRILSQVLINKYPEGFWDGQLEHLVDNVQK